MQAFDCTINVRTRSVQLNSVLSALGLVIFSDISPLLIYGVSVVLGASKGAKAVFQSLIIPKYVSLEKLPAATGLSMVLNGILSLIIGPLIGKQSKAFFY